MIRSRKVKLLKYKEFYIESSFPFSMTSDIGKAKNYYPFALPMSVLNYWINQVPCKVVNGLSVNAKFDSKFEVETGGIKGWFGKLMLKIIRWLEEKQGSLQ